MRELFIQASYLIASALFILGLRSLTRPDRARRGMQQAAVGMLFAIVGTLLNHTLVDYRWIAAGLVLGVVIGYPMGQWVPMTAMPQRIAIALTFSALAATLVGVAEYHSEIVAGGLPTRATMLALDFEIILGSITVGGTIVAAGKLQEWITSRAVTYTGQNLVNAAFFLGIIALAVYTIVDPAAGWAFYAMIAASFVFGILFVIPIGGADMPVVVALLNSYSGLASCAMGFAIGNVILIISGSLDGASGFILSILMSKAMNRSFRNVLFGAFGSETAAIGAKSSAGLSVRSISVEDAAIQLAYAQLVIVIPGYGMAVAQAQHAVRELAELIEKRGGEVKFAVHPVAGRMPGHMNVLLAEANVPYDKLYDMDEINSEFDRADVALVIGANDVVNPAARNDKASPIYGMPILNADHAKSVIVLKRGMSAGFAGIENELFYDKRTSMLFGDAKASLTGLITEIKNV
ncbi:MAG TPA: NAD(P)(+) transhydrogenase (Re/Si-specific) subunit beta [Gemmatimonadaceae bacterium]|jgi:NAD(P) transhydrogenase subunit beta|nr:NAD(P)(+) transhydrogenase (Re/Si-specific) subunit beta [Gemmatimonadaceae bacterium]